MTTHAHDLNFDWGAMVAFAEQEAEQLMPFLDEATTALLEHSQGEVRRILEVGCGPGVGTCVLAERFPDAEVVATDASPEMLAAATARAHRLGLSSRVTARQVDLPHGLDGTGPVDVVWASMVLHHVGDEAATLRALRAHLAPGGILGIAEFGDPLRVVPDEVDFGRPGLWDRLDAASWAWVAAMRAGLADTTPSEDYPVMLVDAGFEVLVDRMMRIRLEAPLDDQARRVAHSHLKHLRSRVEPYAVAADLEAVDALLDEDGATGVLHRPDAFLHASRRLIVAR